MDGVRRKGTASLAATESPGRDWRVRFSAAPGCSLRRRFRASLAGRRPLDIKLGLALLHGRITALEIVTDRSAATAADQLGARRCRPVDIALRSAFFARPMLLFALRDDICALQYLTRKLLRGCRPSTLSMRCRPECGTPPLVPFSNRARCHLLPAAGLFSPRLPY